MTDKIVFNLEDYQNMFGEEEGLTNWFSVRDGDGELLVTEDFDFLPIDDEIQMIAGDDIYEGKPDEVVPQSSKVDLDENDDAARIRAINLFKNDCSPVLPAVLWEVSQKVEVETKTEPFIDEFISQYKVVYTRSGDRCDLVNGIGLGSYGSSRLRPSYMVPTESGLIITCPDDDDPEEIVSTVRVLPKGVMCAVLSFHHRKTQVCFSLLCMMNRFYPVKIFFLNSRGQNVLSFPSFYVTVTREKIFYVDSADYDTKTLFYMELFGEQYRLNPKISLYPRYLPTLANFPSNKVSKIEINDAVFVRYIRVVYQILEIRGRKYASLRMYTAGIMNKMRLCTGCPSCLFKSCDFAPVFRVPNWFDEPRYEFFYSSVKFMPNPEQIRCYEKIFPLGSKWGKSDVFFRSTNKQVMYQSDYMDIVETKTIRDVAEFHFKGIYSRFSQTYAHLISRSYVDYPMCQGDLKLQYRSIATQKLLGLGFLPCGRRVFFFSAGGEEKAHPVDAMCKNLSVIASYGAGTMVLLGSAHGVDVKEEHKPLLRNLLKTCQSMKFGDYNNLNEGDDMDVIQ